MDLSSIIKLEMPGSCVRRRNRVTTSDYDGRKQRLTRLEGLQRWFFFFRSPLAYSGYSPTQIYIGEDGIFDSPCCFSIPDPELTGI